MGCLLILFLVLLVAGEGVWTTKEGGWMNKEESISSRRVRETNRLYDCRLSMVPMMNQLMMLTIVC